VCSWNYEKRLLDSCLSFCQSVHQSASNNSVPSGQFFTKFGFRGFVVNVSKRFRLDYNRTRITCTLHEYQYGLANFFLEWEIFRIQDVEEIRKIQLLPYSRSIGSWICLTHKTYTCHTVQNTIRYDIFTGMKVRYTIFERVTMYNNTKRTIRKLQRFISTVILL
jgi:hypothetical protein